MRIYEDEDEDDDDDDDDDIYDVSLLQPSSLRVWLCLKPSLSNCVP